MDREIDMLCRPVPGRSRWIVGVALHAAILSACTFAPEGGLGPGSDATPQPDDGRTVDMGVPTDTPPVDAPGPRLPRDVVHVPQEGWEGGTTDSTWTDDVTIDTTALTISGSGTDGLTLRAQAHEPSSGPELALLHVGTLTVDDVDVRVTGSRPLVIISSGSITLNGRINAGADRDTPGAGGAAPGAGAGNGQDGSHTSDTPNDGGGGGGGHATAGGRGGLGCNSSGGDTCNDSGVAQGGPGGAAYGEASLPALFGGSGGGRGGEGDGSCPGGEGGAGGGAVQLYAIDTITIGAGGGISVGGGGGESGIRESDCAASAGGGGGSGGAVYLQAARIQIDGVVAANGGGGGSGATGLMTGNDGANGSLDQTAAAGGVDPGEGASAGGVGAAGGNGPQQGEDQSDEPNAGGGGGAAGRIFLSCSDLGGTGRLSPAGFATAGCQL